METTVRLLVAEDDDADARIVLLALRAAGFGDDVLTVADGKEVLDYLYRRGAAADRSPLCPALVLLDLKMPRVDGFGVLAAVKADSALRVIPIVVLTSSCEARDLAQAYALGADGYVVKPMGFDACAASLAAVCRFWLDVNEAPPACVGRNKRSHPEGRGAVSWTAK